MNLDISETQTNDNDNHFLFQIDDLNFTGYQQKQLELICTYSLPLKTRFSKLVVVLYEHQKFHSWVNTQSYLKDISESQIITLLIETINRYTLNFQGNLIKNAVNLNDSSFWKKLVGVFMELDEKNKPNENQDIIVSENTDTVQNITNVLNNNDLDSQVVQKVHQTLKSHKYIQQYNKKNKSKHKKIIRI